MKLNISTTRQEKLKFLNDLKNGKTSLKDLSPVGFGDVWFSSRGGLTLENSRTCETISRNDFQKRPGGTITFK